MKNGGNILLRLLVWTILLVLLVLAVRHASRMRRQTTVQRIEISVEDSASCRIVSSGMIREWLHAKRAEYLGEPIDSVDTRKIEQIISSHLFVENVRAFTDLRGTLRIRVAQRRPVLRVESSNGYRFYLTDDGYILPLQNHFATYVPIVTGFCPFPFAPGTQGDYQEVVRKAADHFREELASITHEQTRLSTEREKVRLSIREWRSKRPKRLQSEEKRKLFLQQKERTLAELGTELERLDRSLAENERKRLNLLEAQKKSEKRHLFLTKLLTFVKWTEKDDFWSSQIVQLNVLADNQTDLHPEIEIVPRAGNHIVLLGELDGTEQEKLDKLRLFYREALDWEGWDAQRYINLKFKDQIVCSK